MGEPLEASSAAPPGLPSAECLQHMPGAGDAVGTARFPLSQHLSATRGRAEHEKKAVYLYCLGCYGSGCLGSCPEEGGPDWGDLGGK